MAARTTAGVSEGSKVFAAVWEVQDGTFNVLDVYARADVDRRTVLDRLADLEELGVVERVEDGRSKKWRTVVPSAG